MMLVMTNQNFRAFIYSFISLFAFTIPKSSEAVDECASSLIMDNFNGSYSQVSTLAAVRLRYGEKNTAEDNSMNAVIPIKGVNAGFDVKTGRSNAESYFDESDLQWDDKRLESVATQRLSEGAVETYKLCRSTIPATGTRVIVYDATEKSATISVSWYSAPEAPTKTEGDVALDGGSLNSPFPTIWKTGEKITRIITRVSSEDLRVVANIGGSSASQFISQLPAPASPPAKAAGISIGSCIGKGGVEGVRIWGPPSEYCNGISDWGRYDARTQPISKLGWCIGKGGVEGVRLYGPLNEDCGGIGVWGKYANPVDITAIGISSCKGHGKILEGHELWGPTGALCGGMSDPRWGKYDSSKKN